MSILIILLVSGEELIYDMKSISILGIGVSTLFPKQCPVRCTTGRKPQCREFYRVVDGLDPAPKSSGNSDQMMMKLFCFLRIVLSLRLGVYFVILFGLLSCLP